MGLYTNEKRRGINRADKQKCFFESTYERYIRENDSRGVCVFISHRSTDKDVASIIANYLCESGIDVYIDLTDQGLQAATKNNDSQAIVSHIQNALKLSTHILVLISDDTRASWWVPYEIGYGEKSEKIISSMLLERDEVDCFPDYLKIVERLFNVNDFENYVKKLKIKSSEYGGLLENANSIMIPDTSIIAQYIKEVDPD